MLQAMVDTGNTKWDAVVQALGMGVDSRRALGRGGTCAGKAGFLALVKKAVASRRRRWMPLVHLEIPLYGMVPVYNTKVKAVKGHPPTSWAQPVGYLGGHSRTKRGTCFDGPRYTLEAALLADGVAPDKLYPPDVDRAFKSLDKIKDQVARVWKQWPRATVLGGLRRN